MLVFLLFILDIVVHGEAIGEVLRVLILVRHFHGAWWDVSDLVEVLLMGLIHRPMEHRIGWREQISVFWLFRYHCLQMGESVFVLCEHFVHSLSVHDSWLGWLLHVLLEVSLDSVFIETGCMMNGHQRASISVHWRYIVSEIHICSLSKLHLVL